MIEDYFSDPPDDPAGQRPRDRKIDEAKEVIFDRYFAEGQEVYYGRQLEIWNEAEFFHWITKRALNELVSQGLIGFNIENLDYHKAHFYYPRKHRYPRRQITATIGLIKEFSDPVFTRAVGHHGEMLIESAFARTGFRILAQKVRQVDNFTWTESGHDLDFLIERDGRRFGVEVKNQLGYIDKTEFETKLAMCKHFGIKPLFATRMMPTNYISQVVSSGGYALITQNQNYPLLAGDLAKRVASTLKLPVAVIQRLPDTALVRFDRFFTKVQRD